MAETTLICLPFSGAGASFFRGWQAGAPAGCTILPVQLPGREERFVEPLLADVGLAVDDVWRRLHTDLPGGTRVALFGHSLGAVLAYELAHRLTGEREVAGLFVSGSPDPWNGRTECATGLADDEFVARVESFAGYTHPALADAEVRELVLPLLRADVEMHENYRPSRAEPLGVPVTVFRGRDDELVTPEDSAGWRRATTARFETAELDGGHMYLTEHPGALLALIGARLEPARTR
ncbi:thioesterase II family protein [Amycolatopsis sp. NPDC088138]|uniref:thioesterase II family protein n=1 Tax=Amycolatopsis sp. NPDC088138 TaxID=3363938 RepID=UPI003822B64F